MDSKDSFWDIGSLLPKKKRPQAMGEHGDIPLNQITDGKKSTDIGVKKQEALRLHGVCEEDVLRDYAPEDNILISRVRVLKRKSNMHLFHGFYTDGVLWQSYEGKCCPYVPYFSFVPQYEQLNASQKAYYLYFRDEANKGNFLQAGQSYVMLYIFEIINLPEFISPEIGVMRLAKIWAAYRSQLPMLDKSMISWLSDYALLHGVSCPFSLLSPFLNEILEKSNLKEFYLGLGEDGRADAIEAFLRLASSYRYENSRYAQGKNKKLFSTHICRAVARALPRALSENKKVTFQMVTKRYDAFVGALWSGTERYSLDVTYCSVTGTDELKILMTAIVKYTENRLRAHLSVKSRLSVSCLPDAYRALLDEYFAYALPLPSKKAKDTREDEEYEALYDAPSHVLSVSDAEKIEQSSWDNTWRLIPEEEKTEIFAAASVAPLKDEQAQTEHTPFLSSEEKTFLSFLLQGRAADARRYAKACGVEYMSMGERINLSFSERMGDVALEIVGEDLCVISDYENEIRDALNEE